MVGRLRDRLNELDAWERLIEDFPAARTRTISWVEYDGEQLPLLAVSLGSTSPEAPTLALVGGVHGLERVGSQIVLAYLESLKAALSWDKTLASLLERVRFCALPLVNPVGTALGFRSNGRGVDLMRNAPVDAEAPGYFVELYRGQRLSPWLPWYRGNPHEMEIEARAVAEFIDEEVGSSSVAIALDVHSGFLRTDRLWFPYARSKRPFPATAEVAALRHLLRETYPHHRYRFEPQALNYTTHGDLWDYIYDRRRERFSEKVFLPLTLEISSEPWYRKNPRQVLTRIGLFHPVKATRLSRVLHRHKTLFEFLLRALYSHEAWLPRVKEHKNALQREAMELWFSSGRP